MSDLHERVRAFAGARLESMLAKPALWGSPESVELQVLLMLELSAVVADPSMDERAVHREIGAALEAFLARFPDAGPRGLASAVAESGEAGFARELRTFADEWRAAHPPANPFEQHPLVLRLAFPSQEPRASVVSATFETFRKVLRAMGREASSGRPVRPLELATDFLLEPVDVERVDGVRRVVMPLRLAPAEQRLDGADEAEEALLKSLTHVVTVAEWAHDGSEIAALAEALPAEETRRRAAYQVARLVPRRASGCSSVEIGGTLLSRARPIALAPSATSRLLTVLAHGEPEQPFTLRGTVRMQDLDFGVIALRPAGGRARMEIALSDDLLARAEDWLDAEVEVTGKQFRAPGAKTYYFAEEVRVTAEAAAE